MDSDAPAAAVLKAVSEAHPGAMVVIASQGPAVPPEETP